jgi:transposase
MEFWIVRYELSDFEWAAIKPLQHAACIARNRSQSMGRSRGGLTSEIHAGEAHDNRLALSLLSRLRSGSMLLADRGYDADWIRAFATERVLGPTFRPDPTARSRSASAHTFIAPEI